MILENGVIRTLDPSLPVARALAVAGGRIAGGIGTHETSLASPEVVDLGGRCVAARLHGLARPLRRRGPLRSRSCGSRTRARSKRRSRACATRSQGCGRARWLRGRGWRSGDWSPNVEPTKRELDELTTDVPIALMARDSHSLWLNSAALARANGDLEVPGGVVERDERGEPTGVLREESCWTFRDRHVEISDDEYVEAMRVGMKLANSRGVVAVHDKDGWLGALRFWQELREREALTLRVWQSLPHEKVGELESRRRAVGPRRRVPARRLPEGVHGRDARLADRAAARRLGRADHLARGAGGDRAPRRARRLPRRGARDRRPREPRGARRVRGDAGRLAPARAPAPDRARAAARGRGRPPLRAARRRRVGAVHARGLRPRPRRTLLGRRVAPRVSLAGALGRRHARRERLGRADRRARPLGGRRGRRAQDAGTTASRGTRRKPSRSTRRCSRRASTRRSSRATSAAAGGSSPASRPTSSCSTATRTRSSPTHSATCRSSRRWSTAGGFTTRRRGTERSLYFGTASSL